MPPRGIEAEYRGAAAGCPSRLNAVVRRRYSRAMTHTPPIPAAFRDVLVDLPELTFSGEGTRFHQCFGCGPTHEIGLRVRCFRAAGEVLSPIVVARRYEGPPGVVHGGIVAAYLDEVLAGAAVHHTGRLYRRIVGALREADYRSSACSSGGAARPRPRGSTSTWKPRSRTSRRGRSSRERRAASSPCPRREMEPAPNLLPAKSVSG
jgi:hypothetical protein